MPVKVRGVFDINPSCFSTQRHQAHPRGPFLARCTSRKVIRIPWHQAINETDHLHASRIKERPEIECDAILVKSGEAYAVRVLTVRLQTWSWYYKELPVPYFRSSFGHAGCTTFRLMGSVFRVRQSFLTCHTVHQSRGAIPDDSVEITLFGEFVSRNKVA